LFKLGSSLTPEQRTIKKEQDNNKSKEAPPKKRKLADGGKTTIFLDWRAKNAVTPAKDQMKCAACYAFAANAAVESAYAIKSGQLVSFSE
jgi:C1A family cysteine protease